jgi:hypothetical protein
MKIFITQLFQGTYNSRLGIFAVGLFGCYLFLIASTIISINERKIAYREIRDLTIAITEQETNYLSLTNTITFETALARGFVDAKLSRFVYTDPLDPALALR